MYVLTSGWSSGSVINLGSRRFAQTGSYKDIVYYRLSIVGIAFLAVTALFLVLRPVIEGYMKIGGMYLYVLALFVGYVFYDYASQLLYPGNHDRMQAGIEFAATLTLLLVVAFAVHDLRTYVFTYALVTAVFACVVSMLFFKYFHAQPFRWSAKDFGAVLNYSGWQVIGVLGIYLVNMGTNYMLVAAHISLEQIGLYNFAYRLYSGFSPFFALFGILIPKWINSSVVGIHAVEKKILKIIVALAAMYLIAGFALSAVLQFFEMSRYSGSIRFFFLLFPAFLLTSYVNLLNTVLANTTRFRRAQSGIFLQCGLLILFGFPLVLKFGVDGIIAATTVACAAAAMYFHRLYRETLLQERG